MGLVLALATPAFAAGKVAVAVVVVFLESDGSKMKSTEDCAPARMRTYAVRFAGAGQFLGPAASDLVTIRVR